MAVTTALDSTLLTLQPAKLSVYEAWSAVMEEVQSIGKNDRNTDQNFSFRGIDSVMSAVGPVLRRHGVSVIPQALDEISERYETKRGANMVNRLVKVGFKVIGPRGDSFEGSTYGEAADSGDKAVSKAHSVAYRTFLLQALTIPTDEPDPDSNSHERTAPEQTSIVRADLTELVAALRRAGKTREDASAWFQEKYSKDPTRGNPDEVRAAVEHYTELAVKAELAVKLAGS